MTAIEATYNNRVMDGYFLDYGMMYGNLTIPNTSQLYLLVFVYTLPASGATSAEYDGEAMTLLGSTAEVSAYGLANPAVGESPLMVTGSEYFAYVLSGCAGVELAATLSKGIPTANPTSVTVAPTPGSDLFLDFVCFYGDQSTAFNFVSPQVSTGISNYENDILAFMRLSFGSSYKVSSEETQMQALLSIWNFEFYKRTYNVFGLYVRAIARMTASQNRAYFIT